MRRVELVVLHAAILVCSFHWELFMAHEERAAGHADRAAEHVDKAREIVDELQGAAERISE